jgi:hypothetical protein
MTLVSSWSVSTKDAKLETFNIRGVSQFVCRKSNSKCDVLVRVKREIFGDVMAIAYRDDVFVRHELWIATLKRRA